MEDFPRISIYEFKSKLSSYIRKLERGEYRGIILCRHNEPVAAIGALNRQVRPGQIL